MLCELLAVGQNACYGEVGVLWLLSSYYETGDLSVLQNLLQDPLPKLVVHVVEIKHQWLSALNRKPRKVFVYIVLREVDLESSFSDGLCCVLVEVFAGPTGAPNFVINVLLIPLRPPSALPMPDRKPDPLS